jgi:hypothetical protein
LKILVIFFFEGEGKIAYPFFIKKEEEKLYKIKKKMKEK